MANNYLLKYKTFDELLAEVTGDYKRYATNGLIDASELIKVAQKINKRLGDKLRKEKETILYVEHGHVRLPADFHKHTSSAMCFEYTVTNKVVAGNQREYREVTTVVPVEGCIETCPQPVNPCVRLNQCGKEYEIVQTTAFETRTYKNIGRLDIKQGKSYMSNSCDSYYAYIDNNFLHTGFDEGTVYLSYLGNMEDEDGNLIVLDHEMVNDYYEYSLKQRLIENLIANGETIPQNLFQIVESRYKQAKVEADTLINMPDFAEMELAHRLNRQAMYRKFYHIFQ